MIGNPEFKRYVWLEFSVLRLVLAPALLGVAGYAIYLQSMADLADFALIAFAAITGLWGTRQAAASLFDELGQGTWDGQRMSSQTALGLSFGKLTGATVYSWYCGAICLLLLVFAKWDKGLLAAFVEALPVILLVLAAQAMSLGTALTLLIRSRGAARRGVTASQVLALAVSYYLWTLMGTPGTSDWVLWYGYRMAETTAIFITVCSVVFWSCLWVVRQMRHELQYRTYPWAWFAFLLYVVLYAGGYWTDHPVIGDQGRFILVAFAFVTFTSGTYLALFMTPKDKAAWRLALRAFFRGELATSLAATPVWKPAFLGALVSGIWLAILVSGTPSNVVDTLATAEGVPGGSALGAMVIAALLFLVRDIALVVGLNLGRNPRRADATALVLLVFNYGVMPWVLLAVGLPDWIHIVMPWPSTSSLAVLAPALITLVPALIYVGYAWQRTLNAVR
ncbi:MAG: hypothetical protein ACPGO3_14855 [Magnetospiraceae bacterium]